MRILFLRIQERFYGWNEIVHVARALSFSQKQKVALHLRQPLPTAVDRTKLEDLRAVLQHEPPYFISCSPRDRAVLAVVLRQRNGILVRNLRFFVDRVSGEVPRDLLASMNDC